MCTATVVTFTNTFTMGRKLSQCFFCCLSIESIESIEFVISYSVDWWYHIDHLFAKIQEDIIIMLMSSSNNIQNDNFDNHKRPKLNK